jgi:hypothetical protein
VLNKKYEMAAGKARVAHDMADNQKIKEKEIESKALEQQALADFLAQQGVQMEQPPAGGAAKKEMGPQTDSESQKN